MAKFIISETAASDVGEILAYLMSKYAKDAAQRIDANYMPNMSGWRRFLYRARK